jgi:hypothetical protein
MCGSWVQVVVLRWALGRGGYTWGILGLWGYALGALCVMGVTLGAVSACRVTPWVLFGCGTYTWSGLGGGGLHQGTFGGKRVRKLVGVLNSHGLHRGRSLLMSVTPGTVSPYTKTPRQMPEDNPNDFRPQ